MKKTNEHQQSLRYVAGVNVLLQSQSHHLQSENVSAFISLDEQHNEKLIK
jgi:hypothetical protein